MQNDYLFKFTLPGSDQPSEFNLEEGDGLQRQAQIKMGEKFHTIVAKNPEDLGRIKELLERAILDKNIHTVDDLKHHIISVASPADSKASHITKVGASILSQHSIRQTVTSLAHELRAKYGSPEGAKCAKYLEDELQAGVYDTIRDPDTLINILTADLRQITGDRHLCVGLVPHPAFWNIKQTVTALANELRDKYVFEDTGAAYAKHLERNLEEGAYDAILDPGALINLLRADLQQVAEDKHICIGIKPQEASLQATDAKAVNSVNESACPVIDRLEKETVKAFIAPTNVGWGGEPMGSPYMPFEFLAGYLKDVDPPVGYFDLRRFATCNGDTEMAKADFQKYFPGKDNAVLIKDVNARRKAFIDTIAHLKDAQAIIIDLRNNSGGDPYGVQLLCSLFIEENEKLNRIEWRTPQGPKSDDFRTLSESELPHTNRLLETTIFILTSPRTFSAGEEFCNNMKILGRATIVGELTGGGANPGDWMSLNNVFEAFIPTGRAVNPIEKSNWEGIGIVPHHVIAENQALDEALRLFHASDAL